MSNENKISPAFDPFLAGLDEDDKRNAIVIYEAQQVNIQKAVQEEIFDHYQEASRDLGYDDDEPLEISTIGSGMLPMATESFNV